MRISDLINEETNPQDPPDNTFDIPEWNLDEFNARVMKLDKRAQKLGATPIRVTKMGSKEIVDPSYADRKDMLDKDKPRIKIFTFKIEGDPPKLAGWTFLGTLDHTSIPGQVVVNTVPGQSIPNNFFQSTAECDHCNKIRNRNETFILRHDDGHYMRVGRMCLRDFLGHDPTRAVQALQALIKFVGTLSDEEGWGSGGSNRPMAFDGTRVLAITAAVINKDGWTPKSAQSADRNPTSWTVSALAQPSPLDAQGRREWEQMRARYDLNDERWVEEARAAEAWLDEQDGEKSEYMHNLKALRQAGAIPLNMFGYWSSVVAAYQRAQEKLTLSKSTNKVNEWFGEVGDKIEANVTVTAIRSFDGAYGTIHIHNFLTDDGHTLTWFANTYNAGMKQGGKYSIKGTIKKLDRFNDWKQTVLTRVKKVKDLNET